MRGNSGWKGAFLPNSLCPALLLAGCAPNLVSSPGSRGGGGGGGFEISTQKWCPGSRHALWPSVVDLKSVRPGVPVRLGRQQYLLINLFIDLLGCTWGFSREELQTCGPPSSQPAVSLKLGLKMPQGLEQAGREPGQTLGASRGRGTGRPGDRGQWVRGAGWPPAAPGTEARCALSERRPPHWRDAAPLLWASARREVYYKSVARAGRGSAHLPQFRRGPSPAQRGFKRPPSLRRAMEEDQSKVIGAPRHPDSCFRTGFPNVPGLSKAKGVSSNDSLSSCIIILL